MQALTEELRNDVELEQIAEAHQRTVGAIRSRVARLIPNATEWQGEPVPPTPKPRLRWLRQRLQRGDYHWPQVLAANGYPLPPALAGRVGDEAAEAPGEESGLAGQSRVGESWNEAEYRQLIQELRDGLDLLEIARGHGRSISAIRAQAGRMVPEDADCDTTGAARLNWLREQVLAAEDYDWLTPLRNNSGSQIWTEADDALLRRAWESYQPLSEVAAQLGRSEVVVLRRLIVLKLGTGVVDITNRLGCAPNGTLEKQRLLALHAAETLVHLLLGTDEAGRPVHVSVHSSPPTAARAAEGADDARREKGLPPLQWTLGPRQVDQKHLPAMKPLNGDGTTATV